MLKTILCKILILNCYLLIGQETDLKIEDVLSVDFQPERLESPKRHKDHNFSDIFHRVLPYRVVIFRTHFF